MAIDSVGLAGNILVQSVGNAGALSEAGAGRPESEKQSVQDVSPATKVGTDRSIGTVNEGTPAQGAEAEREQLESAIEKLNKLMEESLRSLSFHVDEDLDKVVVTVSNTETGEVIRQMPTKESLEVAKNLEGVIGVIFNDHA